MTISRITTLTLAFVMTASSYVAAQQGVAITPINNWSYQRHSSTFEEGYLRGRAAVAQAVGQANYLNSVASVNFQEANRRRIENHNLYVRKYFENKEINRAYREKYAAVPPTKEQWARITAAMLPDRLTEQQYNKSSGTIVWPHILRMEQYTAFRNRIDELVADLTPDNSGDGSPAQRELAELIDAMKMLLKANIKTVTPSQYGAAKSFLVSLDYELKISEDVQLASYAKPDANALTAN